MPLSSTDATVQHDQPPSRPKRRKAERPGEILQAALDVFAECGFAGTRLDDVARRAGVAKGTLYLYFETKEDLFRAVGRYAIAEHLASLTRIEETAPVPIEELIPRLTLQAAGQGGDRRLIAIARMVIGESQKFPDLARVWHDEVASKMLGVTASLVSHAQQRGEMRAGDPRLLAFSIVAPILMALLFREVFEPAGAAVPDPAALAQQHVQVLLHGLKASS